MWVTSDENLYRDDVPQPSYGTIGGSNKVRPGSIADDTNGMNFTVYNATGGKVIQFSIYDKQRDRHISSLYVVTDRENLGEELAQIITKESLTR